MKYLMLVCMTAGTQLSEAEAAQLEKDGIAWAQQADARGVRLQGSQLRPARDATTVRSGEGGVLVADGPFAETKEQVVGFDILECADLDEAIEAAGQHPLARYGALELRPFWED